MDQILFAPNERVDLGDLSEATGAKPVAEHGRQNSALVGPSELFLSGFNYAFPATAAPHSSLRIIRGEAYIQAPDGSFGQLAGEGVGEQSLSFAGLPVATHSIWLRFTLVDGANANRVVWDAAQAKEVVQNFKTRRVAGWQVVVGETKPGPEWVELYQVAWDGVGLETSTITDVRNLLFEGGPGSTYLGDPIAIQNPKATFLPSWGTGLDRDNDRAANGIRDLSTFVQFVLKKIEEISTGDNLVDQPNHRYWEDTPDSLDNKLSLDGTAGKPLGSVTMGDGELLSVPSGGDDFLFGAGVLDGTGFAEISLAAGQLQLQTGNLLMQGGDINLTNGGSLLIPGGGNVTLTGGGVLSTDGDVLLTGATGDVRVTGGGVVVVENRAPGSSYFFARGDSPEIHLLNTAETNSRLLLADSAGLATQYFTMEFHSGTLLGQWDCAGDMEWRRLGSRIMRMDAAGLHPNTPASHDLGSLAAPWGSVYGDVLDVATSLTMQSGSRVVGHLVPGAGGPYNMGDVINQWGQMYLATAHLSSTLNISTAQIQGSLIPNQDALYDLGDPAAGNKWKSLNLTGGINAGGNIVTTGGAISAPNAQADLKRVAVTNNTPADSFITLSSTDVGTGPNQMIRTDVSGTFAAGDRAIRIAVGGTFLYLRAYVTP